MNIESLLQIDPEQWFISYSEEIHNLAIKFAQQNYTYPKAREIAYLNKICLESVVPEFINEDQSTPDRPKPWPNDQICPQIWEFVNGLCFSLNNIKVALIPCHRDDQAMDFIIPQEFVDIDSWKVDYWIDLQIDPDARWIRLMGWADCSILENYAEIDAILRSYYISRINLEKNMDLFWLKFQTCISSKIPSLLFKPSIQNQISKQLSTPTAFSPRYMLSFRDWSDFIRNPHHLSNLYQKRINAVNANPIPEIVGKTSEASIISSTQHISNWLQNIQEETSDHWLSYRSLFVQLSVPPKVMLLAPDRIISALTLAINVSQNSEVHQHVQKIMRESQNPRSTILTLTQCIKESNDLKLIQNSRSHLEQILNDSSTDIDDRWLTASSLINFDPQNILASSTLLHFLKTDQRYGWQSANQLASIEPQSNTSGVWKTKTILGTLVIIIGIWQERKYCLYVEVRSIDQDSHIRNDLKLRIFFDQDRSKSNEIAGSWAVIEKLEPSEWMAIEIFEDGVKILRQEITI